MDPFLPYLPVLAKLGFRVYCPEPPAWHRINKSYSLPLILAGQPVLLKLNQAGGIIWRKSKHGVRRDRARIGVEFEAGTAEYLPRD